MGKQVYQGGYVNRIRRTIANALTAGEPKQSSWMEIVKLGVRVQGSRRPPDESMWIGLERGRVLAAISSLPDHMSAWIRFTYGKCDPADRDIVARYAIEAIGSERSDRLEKLAIRTVEDANLRISSEGCRRFPVAVYYDYMGISEQAFQARWKARRNLILDKLTTLDDQAVRSIGKHLQKKDENNA